MGRLERYNFFKAFLETIRDSHASEAVLAKRQSDRLEELVALARSKSSFYRELYKDLPAAVRDAGVLPVTTKQELMANFDDAMTDQRVKLNEINAFLTIKENWGKEYLDKYIVWTTSGTTGHPGVFVHDVVSLNIYRMLGVVRGVNRSSLGLGVIISALRRGVTTMIMGLDYGPYADIVVMKWVANKVPIFFRNQESLVVSVLRPISEQVEILNKVNPILLTGYPSAFLFLLDEKKQGRLRIAPRIIAFAGERISPNDKRKIAEVFGCPTMEAYSSSEAFGMAFECKHGWLHVNSDWYILEPVDSNYKPVPAGVFSDTVLVTNLVNKVMPILRYDQGDSVMLRPDLCECGSRFPAMRVIGRQNDIPSFPSADGKTTVRIAPLVLVTVIEEVPGVYRIQIIQTAPDVAEVRFEILPGADREKVWLEIQDKLQELLRAHGVGKVILSLSSEAPGINPRSGKYQQVYRTF